ncbi:MAG: erythromycin biosynthesis sensory transduction protein eryC1, partial [Chitinophagaceae bacterium]|nr:erythromycin biosynthesis sensory transduction protein eryC1 [Chitinophagaceae bacterium]
HNHLMEGRNSRLDGLQAAILAAKLPYLEQWTAARIAHATNYTKLLQHTSVITPVVKEGFCHVYHLYVVKSRQRDELMLQLKANGVETAIHYPTALPFLPCYSHRGFKHSDFPAAFANQSEIVSIPLYPELTEEQITHITSLVASVEHVPVQG